MKFGRQPNAYQPPEVNASHFLPSESMPESQRAMPVPMLAEKADGGRPTTRGSRIPACLSEGEGKCSLCGLCPLLGENGADV